MSANNAIDCLLRAADVAAILNISRSAAFRLMRGPLPVVRFGGTVRVRRSDLERFIASHLQGGEQ